MPDDSSTGSSTTYHPELNYCYCETYMSRNVAIYTEKCILADIIFLLVMQFALCSCDIVFKVELNVIWDSLMQCLLCNVFRICNFRGVT